MKKIWLGIGLSSMVFVLAACGTNKTDATLNKLSNQLDSTANTISSVQRANPSDISLSSETLEKISATGIKENIDFSKDMLSSEELYKSDILAQTSRIKSNLSKNKKYSRAQTSAINELSSNLAKYTNTISYSKNEYESSLKSIAGLKKNAEKNQEKINAKLTLLSNNSNARLAYYQNIINALNSLENIVCECENCQTNEREKEETTVSNDETKEHVFLKRNIDTYGPTMRNIGGGYMGYPGFGYGYNRFAPTYGYGAGYGNGFYGGYGAGFGGSTGYGFNSNNINMANYPGYEVLIVSGGKIIHKIDGAENQPEISEQEETPENKTQVEETRDQTETAVETSAQDIKTEKNDKNKLDFEEEKEKILRLRATDTDKAFSPSIPNKDGDEIRVVAHNELDINQKIKDLVK